MERRRREKISRLVSRFVRRSRFEMIRKYRERNERKKKRNKNHMFWDGSAAVLRPTTRETNIMLNSGAGCRWIRGVIDTQRSRRVVDWSTKPTFRSVFAHPPPYFFCTVYLFSSSPRSSLGRETKETHQLIHHLFTQQQLGLWIL